MKVGSILILYVCMISKITLSQVYNYDPIRHGNFEVNPSYLASSRNKSTFSLVHNGAFFKPDNFCSDVIRHSIYNSSYFTGMGFVAGRSIYGKNHSYSYAGVAVAYRVILFNKIHTRVGLLFKSLYLQSTDGEFDYYSFSEKGENKNIKQFIYSINSSASFSSANDRYYVSFGVLNQNLLTKAEPGFFPKYYFLNIGDLGQILGTRYLEFSYTGVVSYRSTSPVNKVSHYVTCLYSGFHLDRMTSLKFGGRVGIEDGNVLRVNPSLAYVHRLYNRRYISYQLMILSDYNFIQTTSKPVINPQFNISYFL